MAVNENIHKDLEDLKHRFSGDIAIDRTTRILYATDASAYREIPLAVVCPRNSYDIIELVEFAKIHNTTLIPRTAGTSLAGQVVGGGIVVDAGRHMNQILEINAEERWVRVEPGVVLDELNLVLEPFGLFFSPETSASNRCMIGGMVGNNSCGAHSLVYGSTRDHLLSVSAILSDSSEVVFRELCLDEFDNKCAQHTLEGKLYRKIKSYLSNPLNRKEIRDQFPDPSINRRNTGYAIDLLLDTEPFKPGGPKFNFSRMLAGSEGTLAFFTEFRLHLDPLPPPVKGLLCVHCKSLEDALEANLVALQHKPRAVELMDRNVLQLSKENLAQQKNRFFISGDPAAMLVVEFAGESVSEIERAAAQLEKDLKDSGYGTHFPLVLGDDIQKVWAVRKAGLGLLSNMAGDAKPIAVVEDTSVKVEDLPAYIAEFKSILLKYHLECTFNAHIGNGELHMRPLLNLKDGRDVETFRSLAIETARLVKKYNGSLSGEHGDGRLRGEFIPIIIGTTNLALLREIKRTWDPENIFNQGKIFGTPAMNTFLRYEPGKTVPEIETMLDFSTDGGLLRSVEKCSGSGDCRKSSRMGGVMCPSYQATENERDTTRARANLLRELITRSERPDPFDDPELFDILDLCISCKGCKSECPSNVDMTKLKAEFLHRYYKSNKIPFRTKAIAHYADNYRLGSLFPGLANFFLKNGMIASLLKKYMGIAPLRSLPALYKMTLNAWIKKHQSALAIKEPTGKVYLFVDEFTDLNDTEIGMETVQLLTALGYEVKWADHAISGRTYLSKGMLDKARSLAEENVQTFSGIVDEKTPLVGIEPSAVLAFRDEYPDLLRGELQKQAHKLSKSVFLLEEFILREYKKGRITSGQFTTEHKTLKVHGHCQQKAIATVADTLEVLSIPENYQAEEIPSGCCGMAGSFGYEIEHYDLSMKIGELVLFPEVRNCDEETLIVASGTSCRHQILDGTKRKALHPAQVLYNALIDKA